MSKPQDEIGEWIAFRSAISRTEENRLVSYTDLHRSIWRGVTELMDRANDLAFIHPEEPGELILTYDQPKDLRIPPTEVERWTEPQFLAVIAKDARFNRKGSGKGEQLTVCFYWIPNAPLPIKAEPEEHPRKPKKAKRSQRAPHPLPVRTTKRRIPTIKGNPPSDDDFHTASEIYRDAEAEGKNEAKSDVDG